MTEKTTPAPQIIRLDTTISFEIDATMADRPASLKVLRLMQELDEAVGRLDRHILHHFDVSVSHLLSSEVHSEYADAWDDIMDSK